MSPDLSHRPDLPHKKDPWVIRLARTRGTFFLPAIVFVILAVGYYWAYSTAPPDPEYFTRIQIFGMLALYACIPAYLLAALFGIWRVAEENTQVLRSQLNESGLRLLGDINQVPKWLWIAVVIGGVIGLSGFVAFREQMLAGLPIHYWSLVFGNTLVWLSVGYTFALRAPTTLTLFRLGRDGTNIAIHNQQALKPYANIAFRDMFAVIGALALMGLQSIDQEIRWDNYAQGLIFGLPMAAMVFTLPLLGVHKAMKIARAKALEQADKVITAANQVSTTELELLLSYRDRIKSISTWPLDMSAAYRIVLYLIIPPLAWVGAALVENWISEYL